MSEEEHNAWIRSIVPGGESIPPGGEIEAYRKWTEPEHPGKEPNQEHVEIAPIAPYEYPVSPQARSSPGDTQEQPVERSKPVRVAPYQRPPELVRPTKPFIQTKAPEQPKRNAPDNVAVVMSHPETVTMPPPQEVQEYKKPVVEEPKSLTPVKEKELTPVKQSEPERINKDLTKQPQNVNSPLILSQPNLPRKITKKLKFKGRPGRQRTDAQVEDLLTYVQAGGRWPHGVSDQMQRYYKREYPEYFRKARNKRKVQTHGSAPIDLQARRSGTGN